MSVFAAIDIGSNGVRLLVCRVTKNSNGKILVSKEEGFRMPIRLGEDVFVHGHISKEKILRLKQTMKGFSELLLAYGEVQGIRAVATSAMRDATNSLAVIDEIFQYSNIRIECIDGKKEASLVFSQNLSKFLDTKAAHLYVDVGGGSTELSLMFKGKILISRSFNLGTVRILHGKVSESEWNDLRNWIKKNTHGIKPLSAVGIGGNITRLLKMLTKKEAKFVTAIQIKKIHTSLKRLTLEKRMEKFDLKPDRADVIIPAAQIYMTICQSAQIKRVFVPQVSVTDGLIQEMYLTKFK